MDLRGGRESRNVEDRRRQRGPGGGRGKLGAGALLLALVAMYFGIDPSVVLDSSPALQAPAANAPAGAPSAAEDELARFSSMVLADTEDTWGPVFRAGGQQYAEPGLVLYTGSTRSACGVGQAQMGPFYCPADRRIYLDLSFFDELKRRFRAPGEFAQAYVIAHEVGHHVQNLLGISGQVQQRQRQLPTTEANRLSVRLELQADCLAGVWAHHAHRARQILEQGDIEAGLRAASAIGDDQIQKQAQGHVVPDSFTHGSAEQRVRWFRRGLERGAVGECDTFSAPAL